jgi:hypothetical protein
MARAFLSTGAGHHPVDGSRYTCGFNVESALSEARAILAETEPQCGATSYDTYLGEDHSLTYRTWPTGALSALTESLRSFVEA